VRTKCERFRSVRTLIYAIHTCSPDSQTIPPSVKARFARLKAVRRFAFSSRVVAGCAVSKATAV
jgi:hypothetical protein